MNGNKRHKPYSSWPWRHLVLGACLLLLTGCLGPTPPAAPPTAEMAPVSTDTASADSALPPAGTAAEAADAAEPGTSNQVLAPRTPAQQLLVVAQQQFGRPYRRGGKTPERGFDCSGLVWYLHQQLNIQIPRSSIEQHRAARPVPRDQLRPGDLVFFRIYKGTISHVGIYRGDGHFIHSPVTGKGVGSANLEDAYWRKRFAGAGRFLPDN